MTEFFAKRFPEIALLRRMERGVEQGDEAAIAEVRSWSAEEFIRLQTRRGLLAGVTSFAVMGFVGVCFLESGSHRLMHDAFDTVFLILAPLAMLINSRGSALIKYVDDIELLNSNFSFSVGDTREHEARLMQAAAARAEFVLASNTERNLRKKAIHFKSVEDDAWATDQEWKHAVVALLAAKGTELETGKLLESLAEPTKYGRIRPTVLREMAAARDRFNARFYR